MATNREKTQTEIETRTPSRPAMRSGSHDKSLVFAKLPDCKRIGIWVLFTALLCGSHARAEEDGGARVGPSPGVPLEEVTVVGEHPGPGLWKVSRGSRTLFILGTHVPLPRDLVWRSKNVERAIASSTELLGAYSVSLRVDQENPFEFTRGSLRDVLPAPTYARWRKLRDRYIGDADSTDTLLPSAAALLLQVRAYERSGLTYNDDVWRKVYGTAEAHGVPIWPQNYETEPTAREWARSGQARKNGARYLTETMDRLESDIRSARARANAWAIGDIEALKTLVEIDASYAHSLAYSWPFLSDKEVKRLHREAENKLLAAIERAMNRNQTTFAALPIHLLLRKDGVLAQLRAVGYSIEEPS